MQRTRKAPLNWMTLTLAIGALSFLTAADAFACTEPPTCEPKGNAVRYRVEATPIDGQFHVYFSNYQTFGSASDEDGCACGLSWEGNVIDGVEGAELLQLDGTPLEGFEFEQDSEIAEGFEKIDAGVGQWEGFRSPPADVTAGQPTEIRFTVNAAPGTTVAEIEADLATNRIGTAADTFPEDHTCVIPNVTTCANLVLADNIEVRDGLVNLGLTIPLAELYEGQEDPGDITPMDVGLDAIDAIDKACWIVLDQPGQTP